MIMDAGQSQLLNLDCRSFNLRFNDTLLNAERSCLQHSPGEAVAQTRGQGEW